MNIRDREGDPLLSVLDSPCGQAKTFKEIVGGDGQFLRVVEITVPTEVGILQLGLGLGLGLGRSY